MTRSVIRVELVASGEKETFALLELQVCPSVDEWITRVPGDGPQADWREPFEGIRCYQVRVRRFLSNGRVRLVVQRGVQYEELMASEFEWAEEEAEGAWSMGSDIPEKNGKKVVLMGSGGYREMTDPEVVADFEALRERALAGKKSEEFE